MDDANDSENRWRKAANARWERFKKQQTTSDKKVKGPSSKRPVGSGSAPQGYPGVKRDTRIRKPVVLPQAGTFANSAPAGPIRPRKPAAEEDNPWRRAANARWEKHRLQSGGSTPAGGGSQRSTPRQSKPRTRKEEGDVDGGLAAVFDEETMGLDGEDLETFKRMCDSVLSKVNRLTSESRRLIKEFLAGQYDDDMATTEHIVLNDEIVPHPEEAGKYCRETLTFEMDYTKGKWRKIKRRWKNAIDAAQLQEAGIPFSDDAKVDEDAKLDDGEFAGDADDGGDQDNENAMED